MTSDRDALVQYASDLIEVWSAAPNRSPMTPGAEPTRCRWRWVQPPW